MSRLENQVAVVTGASRGLGRAIAVALAEAGADLALAGRAVPDLEETAELVRKAGRRALVLPTDVTVYAEVEKLMYRAVYDLGRLDIVVNNAGIARARPLVEWAPDEWRDFVDVNIHGVINGCRAAAPHLITQHSGKIINIASMLAATGMPGYTIYSATKGAVVALTRTLAVEWARFNIQVNAIAPGWFDTEMSAPAWRDARTTDRLLRMIPVRRIGQPEEIGPLAVYLASRDSDFMTGQTIYLDGGQTAA